MLKVSSYIKKPNKLIDNLSKLDEHKNEFFIEINDKSEILKVKNKLNPQYLEGAIELSYYDKPILSLAEWDLIDQIWAYLLNLIEEYLNAEESDVFFPDQPIMLQMKKNQKNSILFTVSYNGCYNNTILIPEVDFIDFFITEADKFFTHINDYFADDYETDELYIQIARIKKIFAKQT